MDWLDYREKLGIGFHDEEKVNYFMTKIFNSLDAIANERYGIIIKKEYYLFCDITGTEEQIYNNRLTDNDCFYVIIQTLKKHRKSLDEFLTYYIAFINCQLEFEEKYPGSEEYKNLLCNRLNESHIQYEVIKDNDGYFIFPKGVEEFDEALVSSPLQWLYAYPKAKKAWSKALHEYADQNNQNASDVADLFRKALETFLQEFFKKDGKVIKSLIPVYGDYLKDKNIPPEIRNNFQKLLDGYDHYMANYAKHRDATSDKVLEYLMYETGNIIRLLITLNNDKYEIHSHKGE